MNIGPSDNEDTTGDAAQNDAQQLDVTETVSRTPDHHRLRAAMPESVGPYKILDVLGEGGMGVVYLAEQTRPIRRRVALKIIKLGMDTKQVIARFESERQALALMDHPGVAKVLDAGESEQGRPYFVMEHIQGISITSYCDRHRLSTVERLDLFMHVCQAVQHAHQKGIIHRDIKPNNVLVAVQDGKAVPKVIDFGVAKATGHRLTERTIFTEQGQLIGTPEYMSPEQAEMTALDIDTRTDIYSLGVLLYELLVGALPFEPKSLRNAALGEIQRIIREDEPPKPSTRLSSLGDASRTVAHHRRTDPKSLARQLHGDLDLITLKAMDKDRTRRYASATDFAADLRRHLNHEPVVASPPSTAYRAKKFVRRNRGLVTALVAVFLVLVAGLVGTTLQYLSAEKARRDAVLARDEATRDRDRARTEAAKSEQIAAFMTDILGGVAPSVALGRDTLMLREILGATAETIGADLADQPEVQATIRTTIGRTYRELGEYSAAETHLRAALQLRKRLFGDEHLDVASSLNDMAWLLTDEGDYEQAESLYREALAMRRKLLGDEHADVAMVLNNLASLLRKKADYDQAERLLREALAIERKLFGDEHQDVALCMSNLAKVLANRGDYEEAEPLYREAVAMYRKLLGDEHPAVAVGLTNLAALLADKGDYHQAEQIHREALAMHRKLLGDEHPSVAAALNNLAGLLLQRGDNDQAEAFFREAVAMYRKLLGDEHATVATALSNLGTVLIEQGDYEEAEVLLREALATLRKLLGDEHPSTLMSINNLASVLSDRGKLEQAAALYKEAANVMPTRFPAEHPFVGAFKSNYGECLTKMERYADAEAQLLASHKTLSTALGTDHRRTHKAIGFLATLYESWNAAEPGEGYDGKAAMWRERLESSRDENVPVPADSEQSND